MLMWQSLWKKPLVRAALLVVVTLLAYLPATHGGYIWDDDVYVTGNPLLPAKDGLRRIWFSLDSPSQYFPLVYTTFRAEYSIWRLNAAGYHWDNILLHIANALLVWRLLWRLKVPGAWLAAMIFALHPVQVESVAWITERKNVLSTYFYLLTVLLWIEFLDEPSRKKWQLYAFALVCGALALFAKTTACTIPAALALVLWLRHKPVTRRRIIEIIPFAALGAGMGFVTVWWERYHQGTQGKLFALGLADRVLIASHAVWFYLGKLIWPATLTFSYPRWTLHPWNPLSYGWLLAAIALCYVIYCAREDIGRGAEVAALFFVTALSPMLGFIMLYTFRYSFVADHYQYLASLGLITVITAAVAGKLSELASKQNPQIVGAGGASTTNVDATSSVAHTPGVAGQPDADAAQADAALPPPLPPATKLAVGIAVALVLIAGGLTWMQSQIYVDSFSLWFDANDKNPDAWFPSLNLATEFVRQSELANRVKNQPPG